MGEKRDTDRRTPFSLLKAFCNVAGAAFDVWILQLFAGGFRREVIGTASERVSAQRETTTTTETKCTL